MVRRRGSSMLTKFLEGRKKKRKKEVGQEKICKRDRAKTDDKRWLKKKVAENFLIDECSDKGEEIERIDLLDDGQMEEQSITNDFKEEDALFEEFLSSNSFDEEPENFDEHSNFGYKDLNHNLEANKNYQEIKPNNDTSFLEFFNKLIREFPNLENALRDNQNVLNNFFNKLQTNNIKFIDYEGEIISILKNYNSTAGTTSQNKQTVNVLHNIFSHDPSIILGKKFSKNKLEDLLEDKKARKEISKKLKSLLITEDRAQIAFNLLRTFVAPQVACDKFKIPVLIGPPAGGKTFIPRVLVDVLNEFGLKVNLLVQDVEFDRGINDDLEMILLGIDKHWSTGSPGTLYNSTKDVDLLIVILDEIDKKVDRRIFLKLFDHDKSLQDVYISGFCTNMNLRYKVAFICTGNENNFYNDLAFKSRISVINVKPYTFEEKKAIVENYLNKELKVFPTKVRKIVHDYLISLMMKYPYLDVRELLGLIVNLRYIIQYGLDNKKIENELNSFISSLNFTDTTKISNIKQKVGFV